MVGEFLKSLKSIRFSKQTFLLISLAFIFSVACRFYWVYWASAYEPFFWNNQLMISTNDGYAFAEGARDMIAGFHQPNDLSYYGSSLSSLTYAIAKILPFSFETIILYMSVFFSSLIVVPIILIAREYGVARAGFIAALLASVANSYYNRTMAGYYDTDMLTIVLPMFVIWSIVRLVEQKKRVNLIFVPIFMLIYNWWYPSSYSLNFATIGMFLLYTLIYDRNNKLNYEALIFMIIALTYINFYIKISLILVIYLLIYFRPNLWNQRSIATLGLFAVLLFAITGGLNPILFQLKFYVFRSAPESSGLAFHYFNVNQTIRESGIVEFDVFAQRISGHVITFTASLVGIAILCFKKRSFLLALPMLFLGFLAVKGGLRFTIYSVPIMAIGFGYFVVWSINLFKINIWLNRGIILAISIVSLLPCLLHIYTYKVPTVFSRQEVESLDRLKLIADREDYTLAWWDYGYPIRYYADVKSLIDGGKHLGRDNFAVSFALGENQISSANMARLEVEYTERNFTERFGSNLAKMMQDYNATNANAFLNSLNNKSFNLPKKTRDIYFYLPDSMIHIFPVVLQFSRLDLTSGAEYDNVLFYTGAPYAIKSEGVDIGGGFIMSNDASKLIYNGEIVPINTYFETSYDEKDKLVVKPYKIDSSAKVYVVYMKDYRRFLIIDENALNSTYIQLFVFENFDKELFEPVLLNGAVKIYKLLK
ncbi:STT3 domain-containing protein [Campylobacter sp. RM16187]|uniref:STT3 domain-containing protein n=1 Tax=Campylobacter sp. RM16187 TaxID=1660063 RepID=UPI0021B4DCE7|nr:STT3 domain-containing protein [Campylobacter sp. RM16187]QKG29839.1 undecaprenyl-diphosphooligosaccharide--protein glycotransferase [Campylobacter sp. RM16187]